MATAATLGHFATFFSTGLMRESFFNSLYVASVSVVVASLIAVPLAYLTVRFHFRGAALIQTLGVLPLVMPRSWRGRAARVRTLRLVNLLLGPSASRFRWRDSRASSLSRACTTSPSS
jgi:ABC-type spermidine/putrescine transport system permease subunit II